jgi:hypothetical protein
MPQFFFHFRDRALIRDDTGEDLPNTQAAIRHARRMACELSAEPYGTDAIIIVSDGQKDVAQVALSESSVITG